MSKNEAFNNSPDIWKATTDLHDGLSQHTLQTFMADLDAARHQMPAGAYSDWMKALNSSIQTHELLPPAESIIGLDPSGKNLLVANEGKVSTLGEPPELMYEIVAGGDVPQHMVKVSDLTLGDGKFSMLLPPGLDTTGTGKFQVKDLQDKEVANKDGTLTHNVTGELNDAQSKMNIHGYESEDNASFDGSYTTTADGNLLESHIQYDSKGHEINFTGGYLSDYPQLDRNPSTPFRELKGDTYSPWVATSYSGATGTYITQIDPDVAMEESSAQRYETTPVNGKEQVQQLSDVDIKL
jgi:hypothetical protein